MRGELPSQQFPLAHHGNDIGLARGIAVSIVRLIASPSLFPHGIAPGCLNSSRRRRTSSSARSRGILFRHPIDSTDAIAALATAVSRQVSAWDAAYSPTCHLVAEGREIFPTTVPNVTARCLHLSGKNKPRSIPSPPIGLLACPSDRPRGISFAAQHTRLLDRGMNSGLRN